MHILYSYLLAVACTKNIYMNICSTHLKLKKCLTYVTLTEFLKLNTTCNISPEIVEFRIWMTLKEMKQTHICGEQDF